MSSSGESGASRRPVPAYARIEAHLRQLIAEGKGVDEPLPTEFALADRFDVSRMTARQAYQRLVSAGIVVRHPVYGSRVAPQIVEDIDEIVHTGFPERWSSQGHDVTLRPLVYEVRPAEPEIAQTFSMTPGTPVTYVERLRIVDDRPIAWDRRYLPGSLYGLYSEDELTSESLAFALTHHGFDIGDSLYEIATRVADESESRMLGIRPGDTVMVRDSLLRATGGEPLVKGISVVPAGRLTYRFKIRRG